MHYLTDFCRFCLTFDGDFHNMSLGDILEKANTCIGDFEFYRSLPNLICSGCLETLDQFFDFRNRCLQSELVVQRYVQVLTQNSLTNAFANKKLGPRLLRSLGGEHGETGGEKVSLGGDCDELIRGFNDFEYKEDFEQIRLEKVESCDGALPLSSETLAESAEPSDVFQTVIKEESIQANLSDGYKEVISDTLNEQSSLQEEDNSSKIEYDCVSSSISNDTLQIKTEPVSLDDKDSQNVESIVFEQAKIPLLLPIAPNNKRPVFKISNSILAQRLLDRSDLKTNGSPKRKTRWVCGPVKRIKTNLPIDKKRETFQTNFIESTKQPAPPCVVPPRTYSRRSSPNKEAHSMCITKCETKSQGSNAASPLTDFESAISLHHILSASLADPLKDPQANTNPLGLPYVGTETRQQLVQFNAVASSPPKTKDNNSSLIFKDSSPILPISTVRETPNVIVKSNSVFKSKPLKTIPIPTRDAKAALIASQAHVMLNVRPQQSTINLGRVLQNGSKNPAFANAPPSRLIVLNSNVANSNGQSTSSSSSPVPALRLLNYVNNESVPVQNRIRAPSNTHTTVYPGPSNAHSDSSRDSSTPEETSERAKDVTARVLPEKSKKKYGIQYDYFMKWCASKNVERYSESVLLAYLTELSSKYKSSTLWAIHSMLKATLLGRQHVDIGRYSKVNAFIRKMSIGHIAKQSKTFTANQINMFLRNAPDITYLMLKVVLIIGVGGGCRTDELTNFCTNYVQDKDDGIIVRVAHNKTYKQRTFIVRNSTNNNAADVVGICRKYFNLRPPDFYSDRLFIKYHAGKCVRQNVGHHTIGAIPFKIALFLNLPDAKDYTGHCFRRTSMTLPADSGSDIVTLKMDNSEEPNSISTPTTRNEQEVTSGCSSLELNQTGLVRKMPITLVPQKVSATQDTRTTNTTSSLLGPVTKTTTAYSPLRIVTNFTNAVTPTSIASTSTDVSSYSVKLPNPTVSKPILPVSATTDSNSCKSNADDGDEEELDGQPTIRDVLPAKSRELYEHNYLRFMNWRKSQNVDTFSENLLMKYLAELSATVKSPTLWSHYSMLKATLYMRHGIDIKDYTNLTRFLKSKSVGYRPKTTKTFTKEQISKFLAEAPDHKYLMFKVCLMLGVAGGLHREQLVRLKFEDVTEISTGVLVKIYDSATKKQKTFKVSGDKCIQLYRKYTSLRPPDIPTDRFFIKYRSGKCHKQVVGINKIASIGKEVAKYLHLPNFKEYTGHCLKKTGTEIMVNAGVGRKARRGLQKMKISIATDTKTTNGGTVSASMNSTPLDTSKTESPITLDLLPEKSRVVYEHSYARFMSWRATQNADSFSEKVIFGYMSDLSAIVKPSTLWTHYSMLRATVNIKHGVDIKKYRKVLSFLKNKSRDYQPTKAKSFTRKQISKFLSEAPDEIYLMTKVSLIFGIAGALRRDDLVNLKCTDITELDNTLSIKVPDLVTKAARFFTVSAEKHVQLYKKYSSLRPSDIKTDRFFIKYRYGVCHRQVVGIHTLGATAYKVANYLNLPHLKLYVGHSLRKTSPDVLKDCVDLSGLNEEVDEATGAEFSFSTGLHIPETVTKEEVELNDLDCILDGQLDLSSDTVLTDS